MFCKNCGNEIANEAAICVKCGVATDNFKESSKKSSSKGLIVAGYACGAISLLFFPPGFALAGTVIGIMNLTKGQTGHGIAQVVISITCGIFGSLIGVAMMQR